MSVASTSLLPPAAPARLRQSGRRSRAARLADRIPAFLIKELRQSLRSKRFMRSFIGLQILLQIVTVLMLVQVGGYMEVITPGFHFEEETLNSAFWLAIAAPLLIGPPLTIMMGMGRILKDRSLDLVFMTGLSAWRAVIGIWLAYLAEGLLLTLASLPYVLLRYYLGGVDLYTELCLFALVLYMSALLTALTLGLSSYRHLLVRLVVLALATALGFVGSFWLMWIVSEFDPSTMWEWRWGVFIFLILPLLGWISLRLAASHLCPPAESHSVWIRLGILGLLLLCASIQIWGDFPALFMFVIFVTPLLTEGLCEPFRAIAPLYTRPEARFGALRRVFGRVFYAGWPAATQFLLVFYVLLTLLAFIGMAGGDDTNFRDMNAYTLRLAAGQALTIFGAALLQRLRSPLKDPTQGYFGLAFILQFLYMMLILMAYGVFRDDSHGLLYLAPVPGALRSLDSSDDVPTTVTQILYPLIAFVCYFLLANLSLPHWRVIRSLEQGQAPPPGTVPLPPSLVNQAEVT
jgi:hypothetical protein